MNNKIKQHAGGMVLIVLALATLIPNLAFSQNPNLVNKGPEHEKRMQWWRDARFGLFIHWGLYSIPAGVWKGEVAKKDYAEWAMHNFKIPLEEYKQLAKQFNPTEFKPDEWAELAKNAGMGYFVLTTKHHDGFGMYDSDVSDYNVVDGTPYGKDVFGQLAEAFRKKGMKACAYYSQDLDWSVNQGGAIESYNTWDFKNPKPNNELFDQYLEEKSLPQIKELLTKYGEIGLFWFDFPRMVDRDRGKRIQDLVREHQPNAIINGRICNPQGQWADYLVPGDNGYFTWPQQADWECCATMDESWGYKAHAHAKRSAKEIIQQLATTVAAGGNLLLNIGPKPDGTIPQRQVDILKKIGMWMKDNKESIHGAGPNPFDEYFSWGVVTAKDKEFFLHVKDWKDGGTVLVPRLKNQVETVELLGDSGRKLAWKKDGDDLNITLAGEPVHAEATVIKVAVKDSLDIAPVQIAEVNGQIALPTRYAASLGSKMRKLRHSFLEENVVADLTEGHNSEHLLWNFSVEKPGTFEVTAEFQKPESSKFDQRTVLLSAKPRKDVSAEVNPKMIEQGKANLGQLELDKAGPAQLSLKVKGKRGGPLFIKALHLKRI